MSGIITQICTSIQGEGPSAGSPCLLIRLGNCNLNCEWCDTKWTNNLKLNEVPNIKSLTDSLPFKIETEDEMNLFINMCKSHIKDYNINRALITGGEPFMDINFLSAIMYFLKSNNNITNFEIETNGTLITEKKLITLLNIGLNIQLNISPKLNPDYYASNMFSSINHIIEIFKLKNQILSDSLGVFPYSLSANYKFVYDKESEKDISKFIEEINPQVPISIMPLTPDYLTYTDEFTFLQDFRKSCYDSVDYCLRKGYLFSPRLHIFVFNNFAHRNEFEDTIKGE